MATNPNARNRARRKDPFRRAVGAPAKRVPPVLCPLGKCDHLAGLHNLSARWIAFGGAVEHVTCTACDCEGDL